jgi:hypothetical protein
MPKTTTTADAVLFKLERQLAKNRVRSRGRGHSDEEMNALTLEWARLRQAELDAADHAGRCARQATAARGPGGWL